MNSHHVSGSRVDARARRGEDVPPGQALRRGGDFDAEREGRVDLAEAREEVFAMAERDGVELDSQARANPGGKERGAVVGALSESDGDLVAFEVDVFDARGNAFAEPEACAVEEFADESNGRIELFEERP